MKRCHYLIFQIVIGSCLGATEKIEDWSQTIADVLQTMKSESYFQVDMQPAMIKALDAFAQHADEHSHFLGPNDYKELLNTTAGNYCGIGVELKPKKPDDDFLRVLSVKPGSPANKAGILRNDKIVAIDHTPVGPLSIEENISKLKGDKRYAPVTVDVQRPTKGRMHFTIKRDLIQEEHCACSYFPQHHIIYCALSLFTKHVAAQLKKGLQNGMQKKVTGIILDLRNNSGGVLQAAIDCAELFLAKKSLVVSTKARNGQTLERYTTKQAPLIKNIPIIILVNENTASAAEILTLSLKIHAKKGKALSPYVFIAGTKTHGKGSIQEVKPLSNGCALTFTNALYYFPDNSSVQLTGITPDFIIKQRYRPHSEQKLYRNQKKPALDKKPKRQPKNKESKHATIIRKDYQVQCACNLLLLLDTARTAVPQEFKSHDKALSWLRSHWASAQSLCPVTI